MLKPEHQAVVDKFIGSHNGKPLDKKAMLKANPMVAKIIVARFTSMPDEQKQALKSILQNPQAVAAIKTLLPEVASLLDKVTNAG